MKRNTYLFATVLICLAPACTDLSETVYDQLPADNFGNTEKEIGAVMGTAYNTLKTYWPEPAIYMSDCAASMAVTPTRRGGDWYDGGQFRQLFMHSWTAETNMNQIAWRRMTSAIGTCNAVIDLIGKSTLSDNLKTSYDASMRGLRAFWIYSMMDYWGNIPLGLVYKDPDLPATKSRKEVYQWLLKEVNEVADACPLPTPATYGKFTQGAAHTLLAKLYLNADAWGVAEGGEYDKCVEECNKVIALGYELATVWKDNFSSENSKSLEIKEPILTITFSEQDTENQNQLMCRTLHYNDDPDYSWGAWNGICAQPEYVKLFDSQDPRYAGSFRIGQRYSSDGKILMTGHSNPLNYTVDFSIISDTERDGTPWGDVEQEAGARCQKWDYSKTVTDAMGNHFHIFRLADVYLMKAEALLRSGGSVDEATTLLNAVRSRAYGNDTKNYTTVDLPAIALERRFEFAWEAWSRQDDIRFGVFEEALWEASRCSRANGEHLKLYPISLEAWRTNRNLVQNPGYPSF
jgi:hypothetical protein